MSPARRNSRSGWAHPQKPSRRTNCPFLKALKTTITLLVAAVATCFAGPNSEIAEPSGGLTLRQALALALTRSPELAAVAYDIRIGEARILQAKLIPNPESDFTSENIGGSGPDIAEHTLLLGQLIELGGKRGARVREARTGRDLADFDYETKKREVFLKTAQHFVDLLAAQRRVAVSEQLVKLGNELIPAVERRVEAGKASDLEKTRFDIAVASARIDFEQAQQDVIAARRSLAAQWGAKEPHFTSAVGDLEATPATPSFDVLADRLATNPRLARFGAEVAHREATLAREKAAAVPDLTLRAGPRWLEETNATTAVLGFSLPLPFWNRNQGNIGVARERLARAGPEQAAVSAAMITELSDAYQTLARSRAAIQILRESVLPGGESALTATNEGYEAGRFSYLDVLDARRTIGAARVQYLQALTEYHKALHTIEALTANPRRPTFTDSSK
jgi:outer membrane protein, heavy metal efflux system